MIRPICRDTILLSKPAEPARNSDLQTARDLSETLRANAHRCVGMAANMIGVPKHIIAVLPPGGEVPLVMLNAKILAKSGEYEAEEGCLSLSGTRPVKRWRVITVRWQNTSMQPQKRRFEGYLAQIIQHELDHCSGILI